MSRKLKNSPDSGSALDLKYGNFYAPLALFLFSFLLYWRTLAPTIFWGDGMELITASRVLGIAHPTGYPLFLLLGKLSTLLPLGVVAYRVNLLCAALVSLSSVIFYFFLRALFSSLPAFFFPTIRYSATVAFALASVLAFAHTSWFYATTTEVYALNLFLETAILLCALLLYQSPNRRLLLALAFLVGVGFTNHYLTAVTLPIALIAGVRALCRETRAQQRVVAIVSAAALFCIALSLYAYLPIRARAKPPLNWGNPASTRQFLWSVTGGDYKQYQFLKESPGIPFTLDSYVRFVQSRAEDYLHWLRNEMLDTDAFSTKLRLAILALWIAFSALGAGLLLFTSPLVFIGLLGVLVLHFVVVFLYNIPDIHSYFLASLPAVLAFASIGIVFAQNVAEKVFVRRKINYVQYAYLLLPLALVVQNFGRADRSDYYGTEQYARAVLHDVPAYAIVLTIGDNDIYPLWYLQEVERYRSDVLVFGSNFISSGWYLDYFAHKDLRGRRIHAETHPAPTQEWFVESLSGWIIEPNIDRFPIYTLFYDPLLAQRYRFKAVGTYLTAEDIERMEFFLPSPEMFRLYRR